MSKNRLKKNLAGPFPSLSFSISAVPARVSVDRIGNDSKTIRRPFTRICKRVKVYGDTGVLNEKVDGDARKKFKPFAKRGKKRKITPVPAPRSRDVCTVRNT